MCTRRRVGVGLVALAVLFLLPVAPALAATDPPTPAANPDLAATCGADISLVIDRSGSIDDDNVKVQQAAQAFVGALVGTGSRVQLVSFSDRATAEPGSNGNLSALAFVDPVGLTVPTFASDGYTNWDDALEVVRRSPAGQAPLVVVITDGDPTRHNSTQPDGHGGTLSSADGSSRPSDLNAAITEANALKGAGSHVFVVGVGNAVSNATSEGRIQDISGDDELTFAGDVPSLAFAQADYTLVAKFDALQTMVGRFVRELCGPSLNVVKKLQLAGGSTVTAGASDQFTFTASLAPTPAAWTAPVQPAGASAVVATTDGVANFTWDPATVTASTTITLTEQAKAGWVYNGRRCWLNDLDGSPADLVVNDVGSNAIGASKPAPGPLPAVGPGQAMNCEVVNRQIRLAELSVDKVTDPSGRPEAFAFELRRDGSTVAERTGIADATAATSFGPVAPGTYAVVEAAHAHFTQTAATCDDLATQGKEAVAASQLVVGEGSRWQCTFTNHLHDGTLRVVKDLNGAPTGTFGFTSTVPGSTVFSLSPTAGTNAVKDIAAAPGTYSVAESGPGAFALSASCDNGSTPAAVVVRPDEVTTCTFTNTAPRPTISVDKEAQVDTVAEPGGPVNFAVRITNLSVEPLVISSITDTVGGSTVDVLALPAAQTTCDDLDGSTLAVGAEATCTFTLPVAGNAGASVTDTVEVQATDTDGNHATDDDTATVRVVDVAPTLLVSKSTATPSIPEPGGPVTYDVAVTNTSGEAVTLVGLTDQIGAGPLLPLQTTGAVVTQTTCALQVLLAGQTTNCSFTVAAAGDAGATVTDVVRAVVVDDDGTQVSASDDASVTFTDVLPAIAVTKSAAPAAVAEPGGPVTFTVGITNLTAEPVRLDGITDSVEGAAPVAAGGTCAGLVGTTLAGHGTASCTFVLSVVADANDGPIGDTVVVHASDDDDHTTSASGSASVAITDVLPTVTITKSAAPTTVAEPGGTVSFGLAITNTSSEPVTVDALLDSVEGGPAIDVAGRPGTCATVIGSTLAPGATATCSFELPVAGNAGGTVHDVVTVSVGDDDGNQATSTASASVGVRDVLPSITVTKVAGAASVPEPGAPVAFTTSVTNTSIEPVTLTSLSDVVDAAGPVDVTGVTTTDCVLPQVLAVGATYSCTFTLEVEGNAGESDTDVLTATAHDDDGNDASASATATVGITDVAPSITVTKDADTEALEAPGGEATYTVVITNTSVEPVEVRSIVDEVDGEELDVDQVSEAVPATTCETGGELAAAGDEGDTYQCTFTVVVERDEADDVVDTVTVTAVDDEDNEATDDDDATTVVTAVADLAIDKAVTAAPVVGQTGTYTLTVTNAGPSTATAVVVTDQLPAALTARSAVGDGWACATSNGARTVTCTREALAVGSASVITVVVDVADLGAIQPIVNVATVASPTPDPDPSNNTDTVSVTPIVVGGDVVVPPTVVANVSGELPRTGGGVRSWLVLAAVALLLGVALQLPEMSRMNHRQGPAPVVRSSR